MVSPRAVNLSVLLFIVVSTSALAQTPSFDKARDAFREGIRKPKPEDRIAGIKELVDTKDVRGTEDLIGAIRTADNLLPKKREEVERIGKENRDAFKPLDDYLALKRKEEQKKEEKQREEEKQDGKDEEAPDRAVQTPNRFPADIVNRVNKNVEDVQRRLKAAQTDLDAIEATRAALIEGVGRLLTIAEPSARAPKILELASAAQRTQAVEEKIFFIRLFAVIRAPESRDALIELGRLNPDGRVRTAAISALGEIEDPTAIPTLSEALKDEVWSVKIAAAQALAVIPSIDSVPALAAALAGNENGTGDAFVKALEDITGVTFFDNGTLWDNWFKTEGTDIKAHLKDLESGEPTIRAQAMNSLAAKGTLAGVRMILALEGLDPPRDARAKIKPSTFSAAESRPAAKEEVDARRTAIGKAIQSRPKLIRDRAMATLLLGPIAHVRGLDDDVLLERYIRSASALPHPEVLKLLKGVAESGLSGKPDDKPVSDSLRLAAVEAIGYQDQDDAVDALARVLRADKTSKEIKGLCIAGLVRLRREASVRALFEALIDKSVAEVAGRALKELTREDFGVDRAKWTEWWNDKGKTTAALPARKTAEEAKEKEEADEKKGGTTFYGIATRSKRLIYVLDMSGSMVIGEIPAKGATGGGGAHTKFWVAKKELKTSIAALAEDAMFDIIVFADGVKIWKPQLMTATKEGKAEALKWIENPKEVFAFGATNIFDALEKAFEMAGRGATDKRYNLLVDTIMFMSDGVANRGRITDPSAIIAEIARMNEHKKVTINTIGVGKDHDVELMKRIARLNGGTYVARQ
jgi:HEAT repeat protein